MAAHASRRTTILLSVAAALLLRVPQASATSPSNGNSIVPACISLVGQLGTTPARSMGEFEVIVRDLSNNPIPQAVVVVDFSDLPDAVLASEQYDPAMTVDCLHHRVSKLTDANGSARFTIIGASNGGAAIALRSNGKVYQNGQLIGSPTVSIFDLDGVGGVGANDLSLWFGDFATGDPWGRSDYDCSGGISANDFSFWLSAFGSGLMSRSGAPACP